VQHRLSRLYEELVCLDDGDASELFGGPGPLGVTSNAAATRCWNAVEECGLAASEVQRSAATLSNASSVWVELPDPSSISEALAAGAEAVGRFCDLEHQLSAQKQAAVVRAKVAIEADPVVWALAREKEVLHPLQHDGNPQEDSPNNACAWFCLPTLQDIKCTLQDIKKSTEPHDAHTVVWAHTRGWVEHLLQQLRRHYFHVPSSSNAPEVLDSIFNAFDELMARLARLHEEASCLDKECSMELDGSDLKNPLAVLLTAASIQKHTLDWKCKFLTVPGGKAEKVSIGPFVSYLEEVAAVGDALDVHIDALTRHREIVVDSLKASTEASAWAGSSMHVDVRHGGA